MISSVRGKVLAIGLDHAVIEVGGVGLAVHAVPSTLATLRRDDEAALATILVVREDSLTLYGFADTEARELFQLLQTVSGVGPRLALAALAVLEPEALRQAIAEANHARLTQVPGIGKKGAERLVIELRDKVDALAVGSSEPSPTTTAAGQNSQVTEALVGLGFTAKQAEQSVAAVLSEADGQADTSTVLRHALARLGQDRS